MAPDPQHLDDPFDTSDELMAEAAAMEARAAQRRQDSIDEVHRQITPTAIQHNAEVRAVKLAEHEAALARADAKESRGKAVSSLDEANQMLTKADELEAAGDVAAASELREEAAGATEFAQRQTAQAEASEAAATAADAAAKLHTANDQALVTAGAADLHRSAAEEVAADQMENSATLMRSAGDQMAEAERLDAAAVDLRSRGVEGVERVDVAAKAARDEAEVLTLRAQQQDPSHSFGTADDLGIDPDLIEIEPNTPAPADDLGIDPDLIEIEPNAAAGAPQDDDFTATDAGADPDAANTDFPAEATADPSAESFAADDTGEVDFEESDFAAEDVSDAGFDDGGDSGFEGDFDA
ncbi:MAG: hypothetical protein ABMA25_04265 [Ilumatobacteraceae bacterium]